LKKQVIQVPNTFYGIVWHPLKDAFYVSGGVDDVIYFYEKENGRYIKKNTIQLGHKAGMGVKIRPMAAELAINKNATLLAVSNLENDSISLIDTTANKVIDEIDLRPGKHNPKDKAKPGGEFPFGIIFADNRLYVSSMRDYEVVVLDIDRKKLKILKRIAVGSQPTKMLYNKKHHEIYVANSRSDNISVIDTKKNKLKGSFSTIAPQCIFNRYHLKGANPNSMSLVHDTLYVSNGGTNSVAVIKLKHSQHHTTGDVVALYPTGWYPNDLEIIDDHLYVVNSKSLSGSNVGNCRDTISISKDTLLPCRGRNLYTFQTKKAGLLSMPIPDKKNIQDKLTLQVARNNHFFQDDNISDTILYLRNRIKHIIYVVKENRTYDQILGDLNIGNGDPSLTLFPKIITPNHHKIAKEFVTMDNFLDSGSASNDGWVWSTSGHTAEYTQKNIMINYAQRGLSYDNEGQNRNIPLAYGDMSTRRKSDPRVPEDPDLLPGICDVASVDGDDEEPATGYIWNKALEAGLKVRNYGFYCDEERYFLKHDDPAYVKPSKQPFKDKLIQAYPNKPALLKITDVYFHGYDNNYPDTWRFNEFKREFNEYVQSKVLPNLVLVRFPHDHFGSFSTALAGVNTPLRQMSDNDFALGKLVELVSESPFKDSTLIIAIEDDAQDGGDHVSTHRSLCLVAGPYIKKIHLFQHVIQLLMYLKRLKYY
jgi:DNA-binding beta-propeller fold protein YncE